LADKKPDKLFTDGEAYERLMGRWSRLVAEAFLDWLDVPNDLTWLDVGCGNGAFTEELIARCAPAAVTAIDPSDDQLAYARTRPSARMADFRAGDAHKLPFDDDTFDVAAMALVIGFLPDPGAAGRRNGARGASGRVGDGLHVGRSGRRRPGAPDLCDTGVDGVHVRTSTQLRGFGAGGDATLLEGRQA
jgi:SAM-dependent methyltransferase